MMTEEERLKSKRPTPARMEVPVALYNAMALCFYGEGPRYWELTTGQARVKDMAPPESRDKMFPGHISVPDVPPNWTPWKETIKNDNENIQAAD